MAEKFIIVENNRVQNSVMADSLEHAQEFFGANALIIQETEETGIAHDYGIWDGSKFIESNEVRPTRPEMAEQIAKFQTEQPAE